jgi:hypothetical protein
MLSKRIYKINTQHQHTPNMQNFKLVYDIHTKLRNSKKECWISVPELKRLKKQIVCCNETSECYSSVELMVPTHKVLRC